MRREESSSLFTRSLDPVYKQKITARFSENRKLINRNSALVFLTIVFMFVACSKTIGGIIYFDDGNTHNIDYDLTDFDDIWVDYEAPGMETTVNFLSGSNVFTSNGVRGYNDSHINVKGGYIHSKFLIWDNSSLDISGGYITYNLQASNNSSITISEGVINGSIIVTDEASFVLSEGMIKEYLSARQNSSITISGGMIRRHISAEGQTSLIMTGGSVGRMTIFSNSTAQINGGTIARINHGGSNTVVVSGGTILDRITAGSPINITEGTIIFKGSDFAIDGISVGYEEFGSDGEDPFHGILTGNLAYEGSLNNEFYIYSDSKIILEPIPEPSTFLFLALGTFILRRKI